MQHEVNEFMDYVKGELSRGIGDWEQRLGTAMVKSSPTDLVRASKTEHVTELDDADAGVVQEEPRRKA
jgi:hypothetical protein